MHLLPYSEYRINSRKSPEDIYTILKSVTDFKKKAFGCTDAEFIGEIHPFYFNISRNINYRNSFLPMIEGSIRVEGNISVIDIKMQLRPITRILSILWLILITFCFLVLFLSVIAIGTYALKLLIISGSFVILGGFFVKYAFNREVSQSIQILEKLL